MMSREMKHSGIEWIGEIPKEWEERKFGNICSVVTDFVASGSFADLRQNVTYLDYPDYAMLVRTTDLANSIRSEKRVYISKESYDFLQNSNLHGGEVVLPNIGSIGDVYIVPSDLYPKMSLAPNAIMFKTQLCDKYYFYYFLSKIGNLQLQEISQSTAMAKFNKTDLKSLRVICPPLPEQQKIANYLDKVCGEVDEMISLQEQMIEELKAYKQSVITEAVTKGLNPNVPMKDSGIDWIGEVPEHWEVVRLKALGGLQNGISQSGDYFGEDFEFPFISYSDVYKNIEIPYPSGRANSTIEDRTRYSVLEGDVLFTRTSETIEEIGFAATCTNTIYNAVFSGFLIRFRPNSNKLFKGYSKYYFRSDIHRAYFVKEMNLVTRASLSQDLLKNLFVLIPSFSEQQSIASYLDTKCAEIDTLIAIKQAKIEELKDYKKSVIYEYVTGKKEVV